ncbi:benzyl alcohol O-benzoyltransferase-like protein [Tanacetum coccineum]
MEELLYDVPGSSSILDSPLLLVQVTRLLCGGFIFAIRWNHTMCDATGLVKFMKAWSEMAHGALTPSTLPVWHRELLSARNPPRVTYEDLSPLAVKGYYGNVLAFSAAISTAQDLCNKPLRRPRFTNVRTYAVSDFTRAGFEDIDFGWGKAIYAGLP